MLYIQILPTYLIMVGMAVTTIFVTNKLALCQAERLTGKTFFEVLDRPSLPLMIMSWGTIGLFFWCIMRYATGNAVEPRMFWVTLLLMNFLLVATFVSERQSVRLGIVGAVVAVLAVWYPHHVWPLTSLVTMMFCTSTALAYLSLGITVRWLRFIANSLLFWTVALTLSSIYDIWAVYLTDFMVKAGGKIPNGSPVHILAPRVSGWSSFFDKPVYALLGCGDVLLPAMILCVIGVWSRRLERPWLFRMGLIGYGCGIMVVSYMSAIFRAAQPALPYAFAGIMIGLLAASARAGCTRQLFFPKNAEKHTV